MSNMVIEMSVPIELFKPHHLLFVNTIKIGICSDCVWFINNNLIQLNLERCVPVGVGECQCVDVHRSERRTGEFDKFEDAETVRWTNGGRSPTFKRVVANCSRAAVREAHSHTMLRANAAAENRVGLKSGWLIR